MDKEQIRSRIAELVRGVCGACHPANRIRTRKINRPAVGKNHRRKEMQMMVEASLDGWSTTSRFNDAFERETGALPGCEACIDHQFRFLGQSAGLLR